MSIHSLGEFLPLTAMLPGAGKGIVPPHPAEPAPASQAAPAPAPNPAPSPTVEDLRQLARQTGMELHLQVLPHTNVIHIQFVDPSTGRVVREFPSEQLATLLAEIRTRAAARIDRHA